MYDLVAGLKPNWHISVTNDVRSDCHMWLHFIRDYGGWTQILTPQMPMVMLYTDAAMTEDLGWGAWWDNHWTWDQWDSEFIQWESPSIDYLELYAVVVAIWIWTPYFANKQVRVNSDNQPTVCVINNKSSHSPSMLTLIRFFTMHCMLNNIHLSAQFIPWLPQSKI